MESVRGGAEFLSDYFKRYARRFFEIAGVRVRFNDVVSVSVFNDKAGADESVDLAADYVQTHLSKLRIQKPEIIDGPIKAHD